MWLLSQVNLIWKNERKSITHVVRIHWHENGTCQRFEHCLIWNETCETQRRLCIEFSLCPKLSQWKHAHDCRHNGCIRSGPNINICIRSLYNVTTTWSSIHPADCMMPSHLFAFPSCRPVECEPVPAIRHSTWFGPIFRRGCDANGEKIAKIPN